jgi:hypothetical protein
MAGVSLHPASLDPLALLAQCEVGRGRASGPGGQHRNKVETKITLTHRGTGMEAHAGERRSAEENKRVALFRLRLALATEHRCTVPKGDAWGDARSDLWKSRCRSGVIACNPLHEDYPAMLAEAMDMIEDSGLDAKRAALRLSCSASQLIKLVKDHPPAMELWNRKRAEHAMHPLK